MMIKTFAEYQEFVSDTTVNHPDVTSGTMEIMWATAGLSSEAGEVQGACIKSLRKHGFIAPDAEERIKDELGDVLWYLAASLNSIDASFEELIAHTVDKINERNKTGYYTLRAPSETA